MRHLIGAAALAFFASTTVAEAGKKRRAVQEKPRGMMMPDLSVVLGDAWDVPPELSDRAQPGAVLEVTAAGYRRVMPDCVEAEPHVSAVTNVSMQNSLSGGVGWGSFGVGASAEASTSMKLNFISPQVVGFDLIDFVPSADCVEKLKAYATRGAVKSLVLVQEALLARVNGCEQISAAAAVSLAGGRLGVEGSGGCQMFSDVPVAVGVKTVRLRDIPELATLGSTSSPVTAAADYNSNAAYFAQLGSTSSPGTAAAAPEPAPDSAGNAVQQEPVAAAPASAGPSAQLKPFSAEVISLVPDAGPMWDDPGPNAAFALFRTSHLEVSFRLESEVHELEYRVEAKDRKNTSTLRRKPMEILIVDSTRAAHRDLAFRGISFKLKDNGRDIKCKLKREHGGIAYGFTFIKSVELTCADHSFRWTPSKE